MNEDTKHTGPPEIAARRSHRAKPPVGTKPIVTPTPLVPGETEISPSGFTRTGPLKEIGAGSKYDTAAPCPAEDPLAGDKTPAVIAWWFKHHPKEAAAKYEGRKYQLPADHE